MAGDLHTVMVSVDAHGNGIVEVDGIDLSRFLSRVTIDTRVGRTPVVTLVSPARVLWSGPARVVLERLDLDANTSHARTDEP